MITAIVPISCLLKISPTLMIPYFSSFYLADNKGKSFIHAFLHQRMIGDHPPPRHPLEASIYDEHAYQATVARFSPNGEWIASADVSGTLLPPVRMDRNAKPSIFAITSVAVVDPPILSPIIRLASHASWWTSTSSPQPVSPPMTPCQHRCPLPYHEAAVRSNHSLAVDPSLALFSLSLEFEPRRPMSSRYILASLSLATGSSPPPSRCPPVKPRKENPSWVNTGKKKRKSKVRRRRRKKRNRREKQ